MIDVGSGGGSPGFPLATARPDLHFDLLESSARKCTFLREVAAEFENVAVVCARAEEHAAGAGRDAYGTAVARAVAPPPVAVEWCLPLTRVGGRVVLFAGETDVERVAAVAKKLGGTLVDVVPVEAAERRQFLVLGKLEPTPAGFPRRPGIARKRPLA